MGNLNNILYIGPYREFSGAGNAARNYIQALFERGYDVCIAPIFYSGDIYPENDISSDILPLENNHLKHYDVVIQQCHPFDYVYNSKYDKHIGIYQFNTASINPTIISRLNLMDQIIVNSNFNYSVVSKFCKAEVQRKIRVCPELIDLNIRHKSYTEYPWIKEKNSLVFYTIGDFIERKNLYKIITAFLHTFHNHDDVELIIKTKTHFTHKEKDFINQEISYVIDKAFRSLRIEKDKSKQPKIMVGTFDYEALLSLHHNGSIYIDASMAENFGYSVLEAALLGNHIIVNENSSTSEISNKAVKTASKTTNVFDHHTSNFIDNSINDYWYDVDFYHLCSNLKKTYFMAMSQSKVHHDLDRYGYANVEQML